MPRIYYKSAEEIELIRKSSLLVSKTLGEIAKTIGPGVTTIALNKLAETYIRDNGGVPAFLNYNGFPYSLCISLNDQVVHGFPGGYELKEIDPATEQLLQVTKECLDLGIEKAVAGMHLGDIGHAIQTHAEGFGYGVVKELVGHGVGFKLHEKPEVPNYGRPGSGTMLEEGMVLAIEPMINQGHANVKFWKDGWTVSTIDTKPSAHYEHTVAITRDMPDVLSTFEYVEKALKQKNK
jgi:methionyl aminopeptidase